MQLGVGICAYAFSGRTSPSAYQALIRLFCASGGWSSEFLSRWVARLRKPYAFPPANGVLGSLSKQDLSAIAQLLDRRGFYVFPQKLHAEMCDRLMAFGLDQPSVVRADENELAAADTRRVYRGDRSTPRGIRYDFPAEDLLANADVQALLCDLSILGVAQAYLGSRPVADVLTMWWNTAYSDKPSEAAAQLYHFDMDRIKWLKFFIYLTDVDPHSGPHSFIAGSHRTNGIPPDLLKKGYARLSDEEVRKHYKAEDFIEFTGARGTILAEDTRGLHKGKVVAKGDRLVLQLQFSNSLFGGYYPPSVMPPPASRELRAFVETYPDVFMAFCSKR